MVSQMLESVTKPQGFTLIEVMVALAIFAAAASMLMLSDGNTVKQTRILKEKILATQAGNQYLNSLYLKRDKNLSDKTIVTDYLQHQWTIQQLTSNTSSPKLQKVSINVFSGDRDQINQSQPVVKLITFIKASSS